MALIGRRHLFGKKTCHLTCLVILISGLLVRGPPVASVAGGVGYPSALRSTPKGHHVSSEESSERVPGV